MSSLVCTCSLQWLSEMFELPMKTVHSIVTKMIIKEELLVCVCVCVCGGGVGEGGCRYKYELGAGRSLQLLSFPTYTHLPGIIR